MNNFHEKPLSNTENYSVAGSRALLSRVTVERTRQAPERFATEFTETTETTEAGGEEGAGLPLRLPPSVLSVLSVATTE